MVATQKLGVTIERAGHGQIPNFSGDSRCRPVQCWRPVTQRAARTLEYEVPGAWCLGQSHREEKWGRSEGKCICLGRVTDCNCAYALSFPWTVMPLGVPKSF